MNDLDILKIVYENIKNFTPIEKVTNKDLSYRSYSLMLFIKGKLYQSDFTISKDPKYFSFYLWSNGALVCKICEHDFDANGEKYKFVKKCINGCENKTEIPYLDYVKEEFLKDFNR